MKRKQIAFLALCILLISGCRQWRELKNFTKCQFRMTTVEDINLAGVNVQNVRSYKDLRMTDATRLITAFASGNMPLNLTLNIEVKNPNKQTAAMNRMLWILYIDDVEMVQGALDQRVAIGPESTNRLPLRISFNLKQVLQKEKREKVVNFGMNLAGAGNRPSRIGLKVKPSIMVGKKAINYPGFIRVGTEFGGNSRLK